MRLPHLAGLLAMLLLLGSLVVNGNEPLVTNGQTTTGTHLIFLPLMQSGRTSPVRPTPTATAARPTPVATVAPPTSTPVNGQPMTTLEQIIDDMRLPHAGRPHGVPDAYDWALAPRLGMGNEPGSFTAFITWGQLYEAAEGNPAANTRVQIRTIKAYWLSTRDGQWRLLQQAPSVEGAAYREDFAGDVSKPAEVRVEPDGGISVKAGHGYNYHFWPPTGRVTIDPDAIGGIFTTVQARLVVDNPAQPDDRATARYVMSVGADYWLDLSAPWDQFRTNGDVGIGRFRYVTPQWQTFTMTTLTPDELRRNPPPLE